MFFACSWYLTLNFMTFSAICNLSPDISTSNAIGELLFVNWMNWHFKGWQNKRLTADSWSHLAASLEFFYVTLTAVSSAKTLTLDRECVGRSWTKINRGPSILLWGTPADAVFVWEVLPWTLTSIRRMRPAEKSSLIILKCRASWGMLSNAAFSRSNRGFTVVWHFLNPFNTSFLMFVSCIVSRAGTKLSDLKDILSAHFNPHSSCDENFVITAFSFNSF